MAGCCLIAALLVLGAGNSWAQGELFVGAGLHAGTGDSDSRGLFRAGAGVRVARPVVVGLEYQVSGIGNNGSWINPYVALSLLARRAIDPYVRTGFGQVRIDGRPPFDKPFLSIGWVSGGLNVGFKRIGLFAEFAGLRDLGSEFSRDWVEISVGLRIQGHRVWSPWTHSD